MVLRTSKNGSSYCARLTSAAGLAVLILLCAAAPSWAVEHTQQRDVRIGVLAFRGKAQCLERWSQTAAYLSSQIPGQRFEIVPLSLEEMSEATRTAGVDFVITNTGNYVELEAQFGISRIATLRKPEKFATGNVFGAVIFTRADRADINRLKDLRGKSFMGVERNGFGGFQMAWRRLIEMGLDPFEDFAQVSFSGFPQDKVAFAVLEGRVDAGTFRAGTLNAMAAEGKVDLAEFKILEPIAHEGFPFAASTRLYPEWPIAKLPSTSDSLAQKVAISLLSMMPDSKAAIEGQYAGWVVPLDYQPVHELFRTLKIGPYKDLEQLTISTVFLEYRPWIILALAILCVSLAWGVWIEFLVKRRTRELSEANAQLAQEIIERQHAEQAALDRQNELARLSRLNSMGEMATGLAHQLNHPLATIANYAKGCERRIRAGKAKDTDILEALDRVSDQADHAADIILSIKNFIRHETQERVPVHVNKLIREVASLLEFDAARYQVELRLELESTVPPVVADPVQLEQAIFNVVRNALDAMKGVESKRRILTLTSFLGEDERVAVEVQDTGGGIPESIATTAIEPFVSTKTKGLGMGLSISRTILEAHGGGLKILSSDPEGTRILLSIPAARAA